MRSTFRNSRPSAARTAASSIHSANCSTGRSEEHTSELQSLMRISYAVFCLNKKKHYTHLTPLLTQDTYATIYKINLKPTKPPLNKHETIKSILADHKHIN